VLPVTPPDFTNSSGIRVETINIHTLGDVIIGGYGTLADKKIQCMFPSLRRQYPFAVAPVMDPYEHIARIERWIESRTVLRYIVTETPVNVPVLIYDIDYGERDGSGDVYATISQKRYKYVAVERTQKQEWTGNAQRPEEAAPQPVAQTYVIVRGDTLWAICRKFYGEPTLCYALAQYNGIKNANLIYTGNTLYIPDKALLKGA